LKKINPGSTRKLPNAAPNFGFYEVFPPIPSENSLPGGHLKNSTKSSGIFWFFELKFFSSEMATASRNI
jgi:hypothetical protein